MPMLAERRLTDECCPDDTLWSTRESTDPDPASAMIRQAEPPLSIH